MDRYNCSNNDCFDAFYFYGGISDNFYALVSKADCWRVHGNRNTDACIRDASSFIYYDIATYY